ncbi:hypothetical protein [Hyphomonas sp.]|jgi:hypothetical protein|uniref:hypothetical protein n=1 Tax=Hyphomonas sp. TaxID=87 RepID=UPI0039E281E3
MSNRIKITGAITTLALLAACASHDHQDIRLLGGATEMNIATQSVRDVNLPNSREVESTSGVRAANAVKALNEGKQKQLGQASSGGTGS